MSSHSTGYHPSAGSTSVPSSSSSAQALPSTAARRTRPKFRLGEGVMVDLEEPGPRKRTLYWGIIHEVYPLTRQYKLVIGALAYATSLSMNQVTTYTNGSRTIMVYWHLVRYVPPRYLIVHEDDMLSEDVPAEEDMSEIQISD